MDLAPVRGDPFGIVDTLGQIPDGLFRPSSCLKETGGFMWLR